MGRIVEQTGTPFKFSHHQHPVPIFTPLADQHLRPTALAAGPFAGLQGGAVAGLLTAEVEAQAVLRNWGVAVAASAWFLRPTPMGDLRTKLSIVTEGGRVSVVDNTLYPDQDDKPCATVRVTLSRQRAVELPELPDPGSETHDPTRFPVRTRKAAHGKSWFMDAMEARQGDSQGENAAWFRLHQPVIEGAGPLSSVLGPADWTHGIARPLENVVADPNPNLTVQLLRPPVGAWIGVRPQTRWLPGTGLGVGSGTLLDTEGEIGRVSMSVVLVPFPKPAPAGS